MMLITMSVVQTGLCPVEGSTVEYCSRVAEGDGENKIVCASYCICIEIVSA